jgi:predicted HTH domain antitoxin
MARVQVEFDSDVFSTLRRSPEEIAEELRLAAAVVWYAQGRVSQGRAAEIAGVSRAEFIDALSESGVSACQETLDDLDEVRNLGQDWSTRRALDVRSHL